LPASSEPSSHSCRDANAFHRHLDGQYFESIIRYSVKFAEAASHGVPIVKYCRQCVGFDDYWVVRNTQNVQRMYPTQTVDSSLPPRLVLLAPQFSTVVRRVMRQFTHPQIQWVRYHTVDTPGGVGMLFEPVTAE
jgi:hypothetical protein